MILTALALAAAVARVAPEDLAYTYGVGPFRPEYAPPAAGLSTSSTLSAFSIVSTTLTPLRCSALP